MKIMKKISFYLMVGILALLSVIYSFFVTDSEASILMFNVDIWLYRLFWAIIAAICIYGYSKETKKRKD